MRMLSKKPKHHLIPVVVGAISLAAVAFAVTLGYYVVNQSDDAEVGVCSDERLASAASVMQEPVVIEELQNEVTVIQQLADYTEDPNCLYVVVNYYLMIADIANAETAFEQLQLVYDPQVGYKAALTSNLEMLNMEQLEASVSLVREQVEVYESFGTFGAPLLDDDGNPIPPDEVSQ